ncbi:MAG: hypothetical protein LBT20_02905 [Clostridiales bacterium]|jgi:hypothetical protein|nr:hypothetical protein [Clostridiales bacterium]
MNTVYFIATDKPFEKTLFQYSDIIKDLEQDSVLCCSGILLDDKIDDIEAATVGNLFQQQHIYAFRGIFGLYFDKSVKEENEKDYPYLKNQMIWFQSFIKDHLAEAHNVFVTKLVIGRQVNYFRMKNRYIDIDNLHVEAKDEFDFDYGTVYQFVDNSRNRIY